MQISIEELVRYTTNVETYHTSEIKYFQKQLDAKQGVLDDVYKILESICNRYSGSTQNYSIRLEILDVVSKLKEQDK